jgi:hypothetical protein
MQQQLQSINPAAVFGCGPEVTMAYQGPGLSLTVYGNTRTSHRRTMHIRCSNAAVMQAIERITGSTAYGNSPITSIYGQGMEGDAFLGVLAELMKIGLPVTDPLLAEQVRVFTMGVMPPEYLAAHQAFELMADGFLQKVLDLQLPAFQKTKGLRTILAPRKARGVTFKKVGVHVFPDRYDARYINVEVRDFDTNTVGILRDLAFDYFERTDLRLLFTSV